MLSMIVPRRWVVLCNVARFFAGFCLIANGAYISVGSFDRVGDCGEMLRTGTPLWVMLLFGAVTIVWGMFLWHSLGSVKQFLGDSSLVTPRMTYWLCGVLSLAIAVQCVLSS